MKKQIALWLLLLTLLPLCLTGCAGNPAVNNAAPAPTAPASETALERYTRLMTEYEWSTTTTYGAFRTIRLPNPQIILTEDGSGNVHAYSIHDSGISYFGFVSFTADERTMIITMPSGTAHIYTRR